MFKSIDSKYSICVTDTGNIQIVKDSNQTIIPEDEPLILFRGRDRLALKLLRTYREFCVVDGCTDYQLEMLDNRIAAFEEFAQRAPERMKQPGITRGL